MEVILIGNTWASERTCALAAAACTGSVNAEKSLDGALASGHESVLEHAQFTFEVNDVSRVLLAQLTRHRLASYSVESQRYVKGHRQVVMPHSVFENKRLRDKFWKIQAETHEFYDECLAEGIEAEDARYALMQGTTTRLVFSMNARELRHFLSLRQCNRAQWEIRELADRMAELLKQAAPTLFKDAGPGCVRGHCPEKKMCCKNPRMDLMTGGKKHHE